MTSAAPPNPFTHSQPENHMTTTITKQPITSITPDMTRLFDDILGPGRFVRSAYRIREQAGGDKSFGFNAYDEETLVGTVSLTPLLIGGRQGACLLGPLAVIKDYRGNRLGLELMNDGINEAVARGYSLTILVGDLPYYQRAGFKPVPPGHLAMPGPVDPGRLLALEMEEGALDKLKGAVTGL